MKQAKMETLGFSRDTERNMKRVGTQMKSTGKKMTRNVTLPLAALGAGAVMASVNWESAWAGVRKTVEASDAEFVKLEADLRSMTSYLPATHGEIARVAEAAGQLGVKAEDIAEFTEVMVNLGVTTNLTSLEAATALARMSTIMGTTGGDVERMGSTLVDLGNNSATTEAEILELSVRMAAAGRIAGLTEADVFAFGAVFTEVGVKAEAGGTALSKIFLHIRDAVISGSEELDVFARTAGMTSDEFATAFGENAGLTIATFIEGIGELERAGMSTTEIFEELGLADERLMRGIRSTAIAEGLLTDKLDLASDAWEENLALQKEADRRYETTAARFEIVRNKVVELGIEMGDRLIPIVEALMTGVEHGVEAFSSLHPAIQTTIMVMGGILAVAGPLLMITGSLINSWIALRSAMIALNVAASVGPLLAVAAAAAAVAAIYIVVSNRSDDVTTSFDTQREAAAALSAEMEGGANSRDVMLDHLRKMALESPLLVASMKDAGLSFQDLADDADGIAVSGGNVTQQLMDAAKAAGASKEEIKELGVNMSGLILGYRDAKVAVGDIEDAMVSSTDATVDAALAAEMDAIELERLAVQEQEAADAAAALAEEQATLQASLDLTRDALREVIAGLEAKSDAMFAAADAGFALRDAEDRLIEASIELDEVLADEESTMRDVMQAQDGVAESARDAANATIRLAEDTAAMTGGSLTATEKLDIMNESLLDQAANMEGPARQAIINYIAEINGITEEKATQILTLVDQGHLNMADAVLTAASTNRDMTIVADAKTAAADNAITWAARNRTSTIFVGTVSTGNRNMRAVDSGGHGNEGDLVAERRPEFIGGRLVTQPSLLKMPSQVTSGRRTEQMLNDFLSKANQSGGMSGQAQQIDVSVKYPKTMTLDIGGQRFDAKVVDVVERRERVMAGAL